MSQSGREGLGVLPKSMEPTARRSPQAPAHTPHCAAPLAPTQPMGGCHPAEAEGTTATS